jgi:hypothetical protein
MSRTIWIFLGPKGEFCARLGDDGPLRDQGFWPVARNPQVDLGFNVMAGVGVLPSNLQGQIASVEAMLPFNSDQAPDAVTFVNAMLKRFDEGIPQNIFPARRNNACASSPALVG